MIMYESEIEQIALDVLRDENGYTILYGPDLAEGQTKEREYSEVILSARLRRAIDRLNPAIPTAARDEACKRALRTESFDLLENNEIFHRLLTEGIDIKFSIGEGKTKIDKVWLVDFENPETNEFVAVNQFTVTSTELGHRGTNKRPDIVLFVNGLPLVVIKLKNAADENAGIQAAYHQLQTYKQLIPSLFTPNALMVISDGWFAKAGTLSSEYPRFMAWRTADGITLVDPNQESELEPLLKGLLNKSTLLDLIHHFIVFEKSKAATVKKMAAYHQYYAVNRAIASTLRASADAPLMIRQVPEAYGLPSVTNQPPGDQRAGVVWHTQGSGKSLSMVFYAGELILTKAMNNPTLVVLTDRNDLDQQLFETFTNCQQLLRQTPIQAANRDDLKKLLSVASGEVVFTTIQKFLPRSEPGAELVEAPPPSASSGSSSGRGVVGQYPRLSDRRNIVVIADEAHRSPYDFIDGFACHMRDALPNATFIGFTGTSIEKEDANTQAVFGNYVDIYEEIDGQPVRNGKERFKQNVIHLQKAFALSVPHPQTSVIRDDLAFFQAIKARFAKFDEQTKVRTNAEIETATRQIINDAIISEEMVDVFDAAGIKRPDISILSDEFLAEIQGLSHQNLAFELLKRLLNDEIKTRSKTNLAEAVKALPLQMFLSLIFLVIGCFCVPVQLVIQVAVAIWSASALKKSMLA